jgi:hypothetical protein
MDKFVRSVPRSRGSRAVMVETKAEPDHLFADRAFSSTISGSVAMGFAGYTPLPQMLHAKLKYTDFATLSGTSGIVGKQVTLASSLYDPDYTGAGHQPRGFDQLMPLYDHFVVLRSKIIAEFINNTPGVNCVAGIQLNAVTTPETSWIDYEEQARCVSMALPNYITYGCAQPLRLDMAYDAREFMGIPDPITSSKLQGTLSANPSDNAFYHMFIQDVAESSTCSAKVIYTVEYEAVFIEPLAVVRS